PFVSGAVYYRLQVVSVSGQSIYSNVIVLSEANKTSAHFTVSTLVQSEIAVNAPENFQYSLNTINGSLLVKGYGTQGANKIAIDNVPNGIYILRMISNNQQQTERIIKQ
ncbi:MAG TPA: T9SS type A sorting domain-containing protein, partial [Bacteroidia bacterium]|nr:T9SS type A sorting domain-containing protein [Bacteroidia bacterium]